MYIPDDFRLHLDLISSGCEFQRVEDLASDVIALGNGDDNRGPGTSTKATLHDSTREGRIIQLTVP